MWGTVEADSTYTSAWAVVVALVVVALVAAALVVLAFQNWRPSFSFPEAQEKLRHKVNEKLIFLAISTYFVPLLDSEVDSFG